MPFSLGTNYRLTQLFIVVKALRSAFESQPRPNASLVENLPL